jgi:hypothetical protein
MIAVRRLAERSELEPRIMRKHMLVRLSGPFTKNWGLLLIHRGGR